VKKVIDFLEKFMILTFYFLHMRYINEIFSPPSKIRRIRYIPYIEKVGYIAANIFSPRGDIGIGN